MIEIECAEFLSLDHEFQFWGDIYNYRNTQNISVRGRIKDASFGVTPVNSIWGDSASLLYGLNDYEAIEINGHTVGSGRILGMDQPEGLDAREKGYTIRFELLKTGNLFNLSGSVGGSEIGVLWSGGGDEVDWGDGGIVLWGKGSLQDISSYGIQFVESLSENFVFSYSEDTDSYEYSRSVSLGMESGAGTNPVANAKNIADTFFLNDPLIVALNATYPNFYLDSGRRVREETYDVENYAFSFDESFRFATSDPYIWSYTHSTSLDKSNTSVSEKGNIRATNTGPVSIYDNSLSYFTGTVQTGIYSRCNDVFVSWSGAIHTGDMSSCSLVNSPISAGITSDECQGTIDYSYEYSTDQSRGVGFKQSYSVSVARDQDGIYSVNEKGRLCETQGTGKLLAARDRFTGQIYQDSILDRVSGAYTRSFTSMPCYTDVFPKTLHLIKKDKEYSESDGCIDYSYDYEDGEAFLENDSFIKVDVSRDISYPVHAVNKFQIVNFKDVVQPSNQSVMVNYSNNIKVIGRRDQYLDELLSEATGHVLKPTGVGVTDSFMSDAKYSWDPKSNSLDLSVVYSYTEYREFDDILAW